MFSYKLTFYWTVSFTEFVIIANRPFNACIIFFAVIVVMPSDAFFLGISAISFTPQGA